MRCGFDRGRRHVEEASRRINEAANQPRTRNAHDLGTGTRYPDCAPGRVRLRKLRRVKARLTGPAPFLKSPFQYLRIDSGLAHPCRGALAVFLAVVAIDYYCTACIFS